MRRTAPTLPGPREFDKSFERRSIPCRDTRITKTLEAPKNNCGRDLEWNGEHDRRSRNDRPQNVPDVSVSSHVVIARAPAENQVPCARKLRLQNRQRTPYLRQGQPEFCVPAAEDDIDDLVSRCRCSIGHCRHCRAAISQPAKDPDYNNRKNRISFLWTDGGAQRVNKISNLPI
jgi:hypothetical protein